MTSILYLLVLPLLYALGWLVFTMVFTSIVGVAINRVITHWYATRLNYQMSLAKQAFPEVEPPLPIRSTS